MAHPTWDVPKPPDPYPNVLSVIIALLARFATTTPFLARPVWRNATETGSLSLKPPQYLPIEQKKENDQNSLCSVFCRPKYLTTLLYDSYVLACGYGTAASRLRFRLFTRAEEPTPYTAIGSDSHKRGVFRMSFLRNPHALNMQHCV